MTSLKKCEQSKKTYELTFIDQPSPFCNWIIYPFLLAGDNPFSQSYHNIGFEIEFLSVAAQYTDDELSTLVQRVSERLRSGSKICVYDSGDYSSVCIFLICFLQDWFKWEHEKSSLYVRTCLKFAHPIGLSLSQEAQTKRYKRPLIVLICGDRNSSVCFEEMITFELKHLPKYSTIVHGGCKGIDLYAAELARYQGLKIKEYSAEWSKFGNAAGPIRNQEMLKKEIPDMVIAFHPDINISKGTKHMMSLAYEAKIPVYIHDLKRKMKFEGDFETIQTSLKFCC